MRRVLYFVSVGSAVAMLVVHVATWCGFVLGLGLSMLCAGACLAVVVPAAVEHRLRSADGLEVDLHPMGFVYCALLWLYTVMLWFLTLDQRGGTAGGVAACAYAALWWSRKERPASS